VQPPLGALRERLAAVRERIARAAGRTRRDPAQITLLAVTKLFPAKVIREAYELGLREFGENYVREFEEKAPAVADLADARFHLIGHLQSNKSKKAADLFQVIQTVDSPRLARRLNDAGRALDVMLEVKLSEEEAKSGADPASLAELIEAVRACVNLRLLGLMTMPPWTDDPRLPAPTSAATGTGGAARAAAAFHGMSHDLEAAIEKALPACA